MATYSNSPEFAAAQDRMDKEYFDGAFQFLDFLLQTGLNSGNYSVTPDDLFKFYVPQMVAITDLRDLLLADLMERAESHNLREGAA